MLKKGTPGKGGGSRADHFSYAPVQPGLKGWFTAWIAGPCYWCLAHEHTEAQPGTKPCLDWLTDGALRCPRCRPKVVPTWIGYQPLYREEDLHPIVTILHESALDQLNGLVYPNHVVVGRVDKRSGVFVKKSETSVRFKTEHERRQKPIDITPDLLEMWRIDSLTQWVLDQQRRPAPTIKLTPRQTADGKPFSTMMQGAANRLGFPEVVPGDSAGVDAALQRVGRRAANAEPSSNGHHKDSEEEGEQ